MGAWGEYGIFVLRSLPSTNQISADLSGIRVSGSEPLDDLLLDGPQMGSLAGAAKWAPRDL